MQIKLQGEDQVQVVYTIQHVPIVYCKVIRTIMFYTKKFLPL